MQNCSMLHDRQSKSCSTPFFRMALINSVESFKDSILMFFRNSDSCITHADFRSFQCISYPNGYISIFFIILYSIFCNIIDHFIQNLTDSMYFHRFSCQFHMNIPLSRSKRKTTDNFSRQFK